MVCVCVEEEEEEGGGCCRGMQGRAGRVEWDVGGENRGLCLMCMWTL